jgi:hypothetical protein
MPKRKPASVDQLRILNELLGRVSDPQKAEHARRALEFAYDEHPEDLEHLALGDYVDKLAHLYFGRVGQEHGFRLCALACAATRRLQPALDTPSHCRRNEKTRWPP